MCEIVLTPLTMDSPCKDTAEAIYNEAFPERERNFTFDGMLRLGQELGSLRMMAAHEGEKFVGLLNYFDLEDCVYLLYIAVNSSLRGGGYGSKMIRALRNTVSGKPIFATIETPIPGTSNYDQRVKRKVFYDRLGLLMTPCSYGTDDEDSQTVITDCQDGGTARYFREILDLLQRTMSGANAPFSSGLKFYRTENGKTTEVPADQWLL